VATEDPPPDLKGTVPPNCGTDKSFSLIPLFNFNFPIFILLFIFICILLAFIKIIVLFFILVLKLFYK